MLYEAILPFLVYVPAACFLLLLAYEVFRRHSKDSLNRHASLMLLTLSIYFFLEYVRSLLPQTYSYSFVQYLSTPVAILAMCLGSHLFSRISSKKVQLKLPLVLLLCYFPLYSVLAITITGHFGWIYLDIRTVGIWKQVTPGFGTIFLLVMMLTYLIAYLIMMWQARKHADSEKKRTRFTVLIIGTSFLLVWVLVFGVGVELWWPTLPLPSSFYMFGTILWMMSLRFAAGKLDLLPSLEMKYRSLFEQSPMAIMMLDEQLRIIETNRAALRLFPVYKKLQEIGSLAPASTRMDWLEWLQQQLLSQGIKSTQQSEFVLNGIEGDQRMMLVDSQRLELDHKVNLLLMLQDVTLIRHAEQKIHYLAYHDALTRLPNRERFYEFLTEQLEQGNQGAVLLLDLDRFKLINDSLGHHVGDLLLQDVAGRLLQAVPEESGMVARLGGDEFIILVQADRSDTNIQKLAQETGRRILESLDHPFRWEGRDLSVHTSIGVALFPQDDSYAGGIVRKADIAMYSAKQKGSDLMVIYYSGMSMEASRRFDMEYKLSRAIEKKELMLYYQPQVDLQTGQWVGVEALLRWKTDTGFVPVHEFIAVAEATGLIIPIGSWVIREACSTFARSQLPWMEHMKVSVNVSSKQFATDHFAANVKQILTDTGFPPNRLVLEITETTALKDLDYTIKVLQDLTFLGIQVAIDDFGVGYSSLSVLRRLPLHCLKIDRSFITNMNQSKQDLVIVTSILSMSSNLGISTVAEGIETLEQLELLRELGCNVAQGYYLSRPLPLEEIVIR